MSATTIQIDSANRRISWTEYDPHAWERPALWLVVLLGCGAATGAYLGFDALFGTPSTILFVIAIMLALRVGADLAVLAFIKIFGAENGAPHRAMVALLGRTKASLELETGSDGNNDVVVRRQAGLLSILGRMTEIASCRRTDVRDVTIIMGSEHKTLRRPIVDWRLWLRGEAFGPRLALTLASGRDVIIAWDMRDDFELVGLREDLRGLLGIQADDETRTVTGQALAPQAADTACETSAIASTQQAMQIVRCD